jgi:RNA polymerase II subunit A small phosphatase-like protein
MAPRFDKVLILDLDETLVYAAETPLNRQADFRVGPFHVYKRPYLDAFVSTSLSWFTVAVWTSSSKIYADAVVERLFPDPARLAFLWTKNRCTRKRLFELDETVWVKDFKKLKAKGYSLEKVLVVDDSPEKHQRNYGNLISVSEYQGQPGDDELPALLKYLEALGRVENVRSVDKRQWRKRQSISSS